MEKKVAIITGGAQGIGKVIASRLAGEGRILLGLKYFLKHYSL